MVLSGVSHVGVAPRINPRRPGRNPRGRLSRDRSPAPAEGREGVSVPFFGAHLSIAGGCHKALAAAEQLGCDTLQIFTKSPNQWRSPPLDPADVAAFRSALQGSRLRHPTA